MIGQLEAISTGYKAGDAAAGEVHIVGKLQPDDRGFVLSRHGGKSRFSIEAGQGTKRRWYYRLDDGKSLYKLDDDALVIVSTADSTVRWCDLSGEVSSFESPLFEGRQRNVAELCDWLRQAIRGELDGLESKAAFEAGICVCTIATNADGNLIVSLICKERPVETILRFECAPAKAYRLMRWQHWDGAPDPRQWRYEVKLENSYRELSPGVWVLTRGIIDTTDLGDAPRKDGRPANSRRELHAKAIDIRTLKLSDDYFSVSSFPMPPSIRIEDRRIPSPHAATLPGSADN